VRHPVPFEGDAAASSGCDPLPTAFEPLAQGSAAGTLAPLGPVDPTKPLKSSFT